MRKNKRSDVELQTRRAIVAVGSLVRACRRASDMTQVELAAAAGVSRSTIAEIEAMRLPGGPCVGTVARLLHACGGTLEFSVAKK